MLLFLSLTRLQPPNPQSHSFPLASDLKKKWRCKGEGPHFLPGNTHTSCPGWRWRYMQYILKPPGGTLSTLPRRLQGPQRPPSGTVPRRGVSELGAEAAHLRSQGRLFQAALGSLSAQCCASLREHFSSLRHELTSPSSPGWVHFLHFPPLLRSPHGHPLPPLPAGDSLPGRELGNGV